MAGAAVTDVVELIGTGRGNGGTSSGNGGGGDGSGPSASGSVPQRTYVTGMIVALGGILMFFMALVSAYIVRKGMPNSGWQPLEVPRILWLNTMVLVASSFTLARSRTHLREQDEDEFRYWWGWTTVLGVFFLAGQVIVWRQLVLREFICNRIRAAAFFTFSRRRTDCISSAVCLRCCRLPSARRTG